MNDPDGNLRPAVAPASADAAADERPAALPALEIRHVRTHAEFAACVELQRTTWGAAFTELVPLAILKVSQRIGGVTAGAFTADGRLVGFVFGMTGVERGRVVHWSDMLAVHPAFRNGGLGLHLKEFQREAAHAAGASVMYWTYDPLVARNAHLNFNKIGVSAVEYVEDMYGGETTSDLHRGIGTDRLIVAWQLDAADPRERGPASRAADAAAIGGDAPVLDPDNPGADGPAGTDAISTSKSVGMSASDSADTELLPAIRVEIPADIAAVQAASMSRAGEWRAATRRAFGWGLSNGYSIAGFYRNGASDRAYYVLTRAAPRPPNHQDA